MMEGMQSNNLAVRLKSRKRYKDYCKEHKTSPSRSEFYWIFKFYVYEKFVYYFYWLQMNGFSKNSKANKLQSILH